MTVFYVGVLFIVYLRTVFYVNMACDSCYLLNFWVCIICILCIL